MNEATSETPLDAVAPPHAELSLTHRQRWLALTLLCLGELMIVLDTTVVNVALPSIRADLGFSETGLVWVINAYVLTYGGLLLLGGRLGDLYGQRLLFLWGLALFTVASLACGLANSQVLLVAARAVQGVGGAVVSAVALSLIMTLFTEAGERARAMGVFGFVCAGGGSIGVLLGGLLTSVLSWHWVFLINLPIGLAVGVASHRLLPHPAARAQREPLDVGGALSITTSLILAVCAIVNGNEAGWRSAQTLGLLATAVVLLLFFLVLETRVRHPLVPLGLFRRRSVVLSNIAGVLWSASMFAWFFISALHLQGVLGYSPMQVGLAFLPANLIMAACSLGLSARLVMRFGLRLPMVGGLALAALGLLLFARMPAADVVFVRDVLPGMLLAGLGAGLALNPLLLAALRDVDASESGLASGVVNTAFMMGGALGLAVLASAAAARTSAIAAQGHALSFALHGGYQLAFLMGAAFAALAALAAAGLRGTTAPGDPGTPPH